MGRGQEGRGPARPLTLQQVRRLEPRALCRRGFTRGAAGTRAPSACRHPVPSTGRRHTARPAELRLVTVQARNGGIANQARRAFSNTDNVGLSDTVKRGRGSPVLSLRNQATQSCKRGGCLKPELVPLAEFYAHLSSAHALRTRVSALMELGVPGADLVFS